MSTPPKYLADQGMTTEEWDAINTPEETPMEDIKITPDEHSDVVGGSTADRVLHCPGSVKLNQGVKRAHKERIFETMKDQLALSPSLTFDGMTEELRAEVDAIYRDEDTSEYAAEGTGLHEAIAWVLDNDEEPENVVDRTFEGILITPTLYSEKFLPALDAFDAYCDLVEEEDGEEMVFVVEKRCAMPGIAGAFGTSDIIGKTSKRGVILDWKFGFKPVSAVDNSQGKFYGRSALNTMSEWFGERPDDMRFDIVIIQPMAEDPMSLWSTTVGELEQFRLDLVAAVEIALQPNAPVAQGKHCTWCSAKHICPAKTQIMGRVAERIGVALDDAEAEAEDDTEVTVKGALHSQELQFTPDDLAEWLEEADEAEAWAAFVNNLAYNELKAGREVPGKKLVQGLGNSTWSVDDETVDKRLASYGLDVHTRRVSKPISATVARKALKGSKSEKTLEKIIHRPEGSVKMVPISAKGDPIVHTSDRIAALAEKMAAKNT